MLDHSQQPDITITACSVEFHRDILLYFYRAKTRLNLTRHCLFAWPQPPVEKHHRLFPRSPRAMRFLPGKSRWGPCWRESIWQYLDRRSQICDIRQVAGLVCSLSLLTTSLVELTKVCSAHWNSWSLSHGWIHCKSSHATFTNRRHLPTQSSTWVRPVKARMEEKQWGWAYRDYNRKKHLYLGK